jgi:hypothetical protein
MPKTQTNCPRCHSPVVAEIDQLFDMTVDPQAKQKLLGGMANYVHCPVCGYEGGLSTPIVYHDPEKELLLTYFPPDLGTPVNEQEKLIGPLIKRVMDNLPQDKRKGYLFKPQTMFTMQTMVEKILEADGITKEMLDSQQKKAKLIERLITATPESQLEIISQEEDNIDEEFFQLLSRLIQLTVGQGDQEGANRLAELQKALVENTKVGKDLENRTKEIDAAVKSLQEASKDGLTREKLLDLVIQAPSETRLTMLVSLARQGFDYLFFDLLTKKINESSGEEQKKLEDLREKILTMTREIDQTLQKEMERSKKMLEEILASSDIEEAMQTKLDQVSDFFVEALRDEIESARKSGDLSRIEKLNKVSNVLEEATAPPPEIRLIEELLAIEEEEELQEFLKQRSEEITPEFLQILNNVITQSEQQGQSKELVAKLRELYRTLLKHSMRANLAKNQ